MVGLGSIGTRHLRLLRKLVPSAEIGVVTRRNRSDFGDMRVDYFAKSVDEALEFRPHAAVIANPASFHLEAALPLARAGVHLLVEKPISSSSEGVRELIDVCRTRGVTLMIGYNLRFLPSLRRYGELLAERRIGRVLSVRAETGQYLPSWRPDRDYRKTVSASSALGGGVLLELSHEIDYLRWLFGGVDWISAVQSRQSNLEIDVEDTAHLVIGFERLDGAVPLVGSLNIDFIRHDTTRCCTAIGENGSLRWDGLTGTVELFEPGAATWQTLLVSRPQSDDSYTAEWQHFMACIADGGAPIISGDDGLAVLRIIEAARESSRRRAAVSVEC